jgi:hypothetical protein
MNSAAQRGRIHREKAQGSKVSLPSRRSSFGSITVLKADRLVCSLQSLGQTILPSLRLNKIFLHRGHRFMVLSQLSLAIQVTDASFPRNSKCEIHRLNPFPARLQQQLLYQRELVMT